MLDHRHASDRWRNQLLKSQKSFPKLKSLLVAAAFVDSTYYGGSNRGNGIGIDSEEIEAQQREHSIEVTLPPLGVAILKKVQ